MKESQTLYTIASQSASKNANKTAITFYGKRFSYKRLLRFIDSFAEGLASIGVNAGDVVSLCLPNTPAATIAFYGINKLGAIANLLHPYITVSELHKNLRAVDGKILIAYDGYISKNESELSQELTIICSDNSEFMGLSGKIYYKSTQKNKIRSKVLKFKSLLKMGKITVAPHRFKDEDAAVYLPSGGTTGDPKIIMHNCRVFNELAGKAQHFLSDDIKKYKAMYSVLPVFHGFGLCMNMHLCILNCINNVMCIKFDPVHMAKAIPKEKVAVLTGVPSMYVKLLDSKEFQKADLSSIRECFVGGDLTQQSLIEDFGRLLKRRGSNGALYEGYGLTETVTVCTVASKQRNKAGSVGFPLPGTKLAIVKNNRTLNHDEIGEICISSPIMMLGYHKSDDSPIKTVGNQKWLFTGDYGYLDKDGYLFFKQRIKNTIKVSGIPVFPSEIEELIEKVDGVKRAVAIGVKDDERGEVVKVIVEPERGADNAQIKRKIFEICAKELIVYAQPRKIEFREKLPVNTIGKIDRSKL